MSTCLGLYIGEKVIKYAKVNKEKNKFNIEACGVKFFDNKQTETIAQIIQETSSEKVPISMNITTDKYQKFDVFAMLSKNDMKKAIDIEFEMYCNENGKLPEEFEKKYILMENREKTEQITALHISVEKSEIAKKNSLPIGGKVVALFPQRIILSNLLRDINKKDIAIINIEEQTTVTVITKGNIYVAEQLEFGMKEILEQINKKENSMSKAYEICKNTTIYTQETQSIQDENEYLEEIMPSLYRIIIAAKKVIDQSISNVSEVYITGLGAAINNIDFCFQEYMINTKCEVLKPYFIENTNQDISIKDYIEVNSAISLAKEYIDNTNSEINFSGKTPLGGISFKSNKTTTSKKEKKPLNLNIDFSEKLQAIEKLLLRINTLLLVMIVCYVAIATNINTQILKKIAEVQTIESQIKTEENKVVADIDKFKEKTQSYKEIIEKYNDFSNTSGEGEIDARSIPDMLESVRQSIPEKVILKSIENTEGRKIVIEAEAEEYEQLGYFKAVLANDSILTNVKSTNGVKQDDIIKVTIEGDLP